MPIRLFIYSSSPSHGSLLSTLSSISCLNRELELALLERVALTRELTLLLRATL